MILRRQVKRGTNFLIMDWCKNNYRWHFREGWGVRAVPEISSFPRKQASRSMSDGREPMGAEGVGVTGRQMRELQAD